jgi:hypothetical protein
MLDISRKRDGLIEPTYGSYHFIKKFLVMETNVPFEDLGFIILVYELQVFIFVDKLLHFLMRLFLFEMVIVAIGRKIERYALLGLF